MKFYFLFCFIMLQVNFLKASEFNIKSYDNSGTEDFVNFIKNYMQNTIDYIKEKEERIKVIDNWLNQSTVIEIEYDLRDRKQYIEKSLTEDILKLVIKNGNKKIYQELISKKTETINLLDEFLIKIELKEKLFINQQKFLLGCCVVAAATSVVSYLGILIKNYYQSRIKSF
jgi:hypothetical protein